MTSFDISRAARPGISCSVKAVKFPEPVLEELEELAVISALPDMASLVKYLFSRV